MIAGRAADTMVDGEHGGEEGGQQTGHHLEDLAIGHERQARRHGGVRQLRTLMISCDFGSG